jgi:hypothetical protein
MYYCVAKTTGRRTSLNTTSEDEARQIIEAKNNSVRQPILNLQIAKAYIAGSNGGINTRTWQQAIEALTNAKQGANKDRWLRWRCIAPETYRATINSSAARSGSGPAVACMPRNITLRSARS